MNWLTDNGTYREKQDEVREFCLKTFGPEYNNGSIFDKVFSDGRWRLGSTGLLLFRYEEDLAWFMLQADEFKDRPESFSGGGRGHIYSLEDDRGASHYFATIEEAKHAAAMMQAKSRKVFAIVKNAK